ncbi:DNA recombination protein RmuC [Sinanaerobacter sp. ZZT-01]|uniref:DNA recombination protein RmuC n=1 Tax=Sinanaerobacter sp. ZZT-01 TaxID=3111540 RepID=UPI002D76DB46|nr:DNA recombination protein RmuC [Sinanaerobacter sp. ZZT-01]WRR93299.1 DNA recombination protein RmuC [Sinanaerobacter sp. ZZT-01]
METLFIIVILFIFGILGALGLAGVKQEIKSTRQETLQYIQRSFQGLGELLNATQKQTADLQDKRLAELTGQLSERVNTLQKTVNVMLGQLDNRLKDNSIQNEQKLDNIRSMIEIRLSSLQEDNGKRLDQMRQTVDEKLQKTLEERIGQSFQLVSNRLEQVYKGLGEMQTLASGVGDLKRVLSNVKTRGILGEIQLGAILEQILSPEQYEENITTKKGSTERVEFAIKLPGENEEVVYLPIDAKFPADAYSRLMQAYENNDRIEAEAAGAILERTIKSFAKSIRDKYIEPPQTTDFAIMFLPFEGLYAEVVRRGLIETLQREYKVNIAGPTTMGALLNSLQMGFKTLAIQKHSSDVWNVLGAVKTEFDKFGDVLAATQFRITQANAELDKLVGTRTRKIQSKLRNVTSLPEDSSRIVLDIDSTELGENEG